MAEAIQRTLEDMVPELRALERRGLLSKLEVKSVIKKRREFEYSVHSRLAEKPDYMRYIQYEINLHSMLRKRKQDLKIHKDKQSDFSVVRRVHALFQKVLHKYSSDVHLWQEYISLCVSLRSTRILQRLLANALQMHPRVVPLWIAAAEFYFSHQKDVPTCRKVLQRGIRFNPDSSELWERYFRLECYSAQFLVQTAVQVAICAKVPILVAKHSGIRVVNFISIAVQEIKDEGLREILVSTCCECLEEFTDNTDAKVAVVKHKLNSCIENNDGNNYGDVEEILKSISDFIFPPANPDVFPRFLALFTQFFLVNGDDDEFSASSSSILRRISQFIKKMYSFASSSVQDTNIASEKFLHDYICWFVSAGSFDDDDDDDDYYSIHDEEDKEDAVVVSKERKRHSKILDVARQSTRLLPNSYLLLCDYMNAALCAEDENDIWSCLEKVKKSFSPSADKALVTEIVLKAMAYTLANPAFLEEKSLTFLDFIRTFFIITNDLKCAAIRQVMVLHGIEAVRTLRPSILDANSESSVFFAFVTAELSISSPQKEKIRNIFDICLRGSRAQHDAWMWRKYIEFEKDFCKDLEKMANVRWKAEKHLIDSRELD